MLRKILTAAAGVIALAGLALPAAATAATVPHPVQLGAHAPTQWEAKPVPHLPTLNCTTLFAAQCQEPVVADSATSDLTPAADYAMRYAGPSPATGAAYGNLAISFDNNRLDGTEDFAWEQVATVPGPGGSPGAYGFTGFDRHNYGGDGVYVVKYAPNGLDTNFCLTISNRFRPGGLVLGGCSAGNVRQAFIVGQTAPFLAALAGPTAPYEYAFQVAQSAANAQGHPALVYPGHGDGSLLAVGNAPHVAAGEPSPAEWASISN